MNETKGRLESKINWATIAAIIVTPFAMFGIDVDQGTQAIIATALSSVFGVAIFIFRNFFSGKKLQGFVTQAENVLLVLGSDDHPTQGGKFKDLADLFVSGKANGQWRALDAKTGKLLQSSTGESDG
jgi:hypothetical protein